MSFSGRTPRNSSGPFVGIDGSRGRWVAIALGKDGRYESALLADSLREVVSLYRSAAVFGIDVPIGLPETGLRAADLEAKMLLGPRRATVFAAPPRAVYTSPTYAAARAKAKELTGKSISAQAWALRHAVLEAEPLALDPRVHEVHPELAFRSIAGRVLLSSKKTWNGAVERQEALAQVGIALPAHLGSAGDAPVDDVLDAAACAWVAARLAAGDASAVPAEPEVDETGRAMAIHF